MAVYIPDAQSLATCEVMLASAERCGDPYAANYARSMALLLDPSDGPGRDEAIDRCIDDAHGLGGPVWLGTAVYFATAALLLDGAPEPTVRRVLDLTDRYPAWRDSGSLGRTATMLNRALALTTTDPPAAVEVVREHVRLIDQAGMAQFMSGALIVAAHAAVRLGSNDLAARMYRHMLATEPHEFFGWAWVRRDIVAMLSDAGYGEGALTPQAMTRPEIFATLAELQQRHPVSTD